MNNKYLLA